ncbi:MAG: protein-S-isoprenylcysteine O-methyltransferase [Chloroflexota bacterium]
MILGKILYVLTMVITTVIRSPYEKRNKENKIASDHKDQQEQILLMLVLLGMMLIPLIFIFTPLLSFADYALPVWALIVGVLVMATGLWLFWRSHADLGQNWSVSLEIRDEHTLVTNGVYQRVRHPMYSAIWLLALGQPLLLHNWIAGFGSIFAFGIMYLLRVPIEERMMLEQFGEQYQQYMAKTGRILPKFN